MHASFHSSASQRNLKIVKKIQERMKFQMSEHKTERFEKCQQELTILRCNLPSYINDFDLANNNVLAFSNEQLDDLLFHVVSNMFASPSNSSSSVIISAVPVGQAGGAGAGHDDNAGYSSYCSIS